MHSRRPAKARSTWPLRGAAGSSKGTENRKRPAVARYTGSRSGQASVDPTRRAPFSRPCRERRTLVQWAVCAPAPICGRESKEQRAMLRAQRLQYRVTWPTLDRIEASALEEWARFAAGALVLGVVYYLTASFGVSLRFANTQIGVVWAPKAMLVAALVLTKSRRWLVLCVISGLAHALAVH